MKLNHVPAVVILWELSRAPGMRYVEGAVGRMDVVSGKQDWQREDFPR